MSGKLTIVYTSIYHKWELTGCNLTSLNNFPYKLYPQNQVQWIVDLCSNLFKHHATVAGSPIPNAHTHNQCLASPIVSMIALGHDYSIKIILKINMNKAI